MVFNSGSTTNSIVRRLNRRTGANDTTYPVADKASDINEGLDRFWILAMLADGKFQIDDTNNTTDIPVVRTNLVSGQQQYTFATDLLVVEKLFCKDAANGNFQELFPVDIKQTRNNLHARNIWELPTGNSGIPTHYDKTINSFLLDPVPNYNSALGLRLVYKRGASYFTSADTTKAPGIPAVFHPGLVDYASRTYLLDKVSTAEISRKLIELEKSLAKWEESITDFYANRTQDEPTKIVGKYRSPR